MKAIVPVAGAGTRLRPHTYTQPKALIPVAGKPILSFIIEELMDAGVEEFVFVIGYLGEKVEDFVESHYPNITSHYVVQNDRKGLGHAIWLTRNVVEENEDILIVLGDTIVMADIASVIDSSTSCIGLKKVDDPRNFGVAEVSVDNEIVKVVEKPKIPISNMAMVGLYKIKETKTLYDVLEHNIENDIKTRDEFHLTDAMMGMIDKGVSFTGFKVTNWYDCGQSDILLQTNATLLKMTSYASQDLPMYENTIIIHPVYIGNGTQIKNSIVGPNVTIGEQSKINYSIIKDSIIGNYTHLKEVMLHQSVLGSDAAITGVSQSLNIGDNTEIDLSGKTP